MRQQHVPNHSPSMWHDHVLSVGRMKLGIESDGGDRYTDITMPEMLELGYG